WNLSFEAPPLSNFSGQATRSGFQFRGSWPGGFSITVSADAAEGAKASHDTSFDHFWPAAQRGPIIDPTSVKVEKNTGRYVKVSYRPKAPNFRLPGSGLAQGFPPTGGQGFPPTGGQGIPAAGPAGAAPPPAAASPHVNYYFFVKGHLVDVHLW